jgi:hypothetical protein
MRVSDSRRVLFVHVPKTGGSTIDVMMDRRLPDSRTVEGRARHAPLSVLIAAEPQLADYWSFGFVRNPWARMVSWWSMISMVFERAAAGVPQAVERIQRNPEAWLPEGEFAKDFDGFVLEGTRKIPKVGRPQVVTLSRADGRLADFVGRVESFDADVNHVRRHLGLPELERVPRRNRSTHGHYRDYYTDRTKARVAEVFALDIERFGYRF